MVLNNSLGITSIQSPGQNKSVDSYQGNDLRMAQPDMQVTKWGCMGKITQSATAQTSYKKNKKQSSRSLWLEGVF